MGGSGRHATRVRALVVLSLALALLAPASAAFAAGNGTYDVQVPQGGVWTTVGTAAFGPNYSDAAITLPSSYSQLRLVQHGGTAAQLDGVALDGNAPVAVSGSEDEAALKKMLAADNDVTNAFDDALILTFPAAGSRLELNARVQGDISAAFPFEFPEANAYSSVGPGSSFYRVADLPTAIDTDAEPVVAAFCRPGTGHPNGTTYAWVADDGQDLLATVDFTPDNTLDGADDYAAVHVKTASGVKTFKISAAEQTWGDVAFTYTDKVSYQHKLYTFRIPWSEIGAASDSVEVAFTAYGTAALPMPVYRFFNRVNGSHFYTASQAEKETVESTLASTYTFEGIAYGITVGHPENNDPLYRFYNHVTGSHFYTASLAEKETVEATLGDTFTYEGIAYYVCAPDVLGSRSIYRFFNLMNGSHFYTASTAERDAVLADATETYSLDGVGFHVF